MNSFEINQAIVCFDLSSNDKSLLNYLNFLNQNIRINSIYFLHAIEKKGILSSLIQADKTSVHEEYVLNEDIIKTFIDNVEANLVNLEEINLEYAIKEGHVISLILEEIKEHHAELVVLGKKNNSKSTGHIGKMIARKSNSSVLFVPENSKNQLKTIVVPTDFSEYSGKALVKALEINNSLKKPAKIKCLHIYDLPDLSYYKINKTYEQLKSIVEQDMNEAFNKFIDKYASNLSDLIEKKVVERDELSSAGHLLSLSQKEAADMIIIGAKGHSNLSSALLGSVTEKFVQLNDQIPTLIIR